MPPIVFSSNRDLPVAIGLPNSVTPSGTIEFPQAEEVNVNGLSLSEAQLAFLDAYTTGNFIFRRDSGTT